MSEPNIVALPVQEQERLSVGFRGAVRWQVVEGAPDGAFAGFWAEIRTNLTIPEIEAIEAPQLRGDLAVLIAPMIKDWNYEAAVAVEVTLPAETMTNADGSTSDLPERTAIRAEFARLEPPLVAGPGGLGRIDEETFRWLRIQLCGGPMRILRAKPEDGSPEGNSSGRAKPTPAGTPANATSPTPPRKSRSSRASSKKP